MHLLTTWQLALLILGTASISGSLSLVVATLLIASSQQDDHRREPSMIPFPSKRKDAR